MDSKDIRNLQEAYSEVVENQQIDEISTELAKRAGEKRMNRTFDIMQKDWEEGRKKPSPEYQKSYKKFQDDERRYKRKLNKEQVDIYDIILSHLLDEGYADTQESAEAIMVNMSEEWRESIMIDEGLDMKTFKANRKKAKASAARADAVKRGHVGKEWYNSGRRYSPDEARRGRANMDDEERSTRHRSAVDPEGDDSNYSADKTKNPKKLRKQKAMGEH